MVAKTTELPNVRKVFIPDQGYMIADCDLAQADAQVVAWEADDDELKGIFRDPDADLHDENAKTIFTKTNGTNRQLAKAGVHLCLADEHEVLTKSGWLLVQEIEANEQILICNKDGSEAQFEQPYSWYHAQDSLIMLEIIGQAYHQLVTPRHKIPYATDSMGVIHDKQAQLLPKSARLPKAATLKNDGKKEESLWFRLLCAFHADGTISKRHIRFHLKKIKKIHRLKKLLDLLEVPYKVFSYHDNTINICIYGKEAKQLIAYGKKLSWTALSWGTSAIETYVEEIPFWDSHISDTYITFTSKHKRTVDVLHTLLHLCNKSGNIRYLPEVDCWSLQLNNRPLHRVSSGEINRVSYTGGVHCPTVSTGFFLTRYKGKIAVTGNTNYGGKARTCAIALGITVRQAEQFQSRWFQAHPGILEWHRRVESQLVHERKVSNRFGNIRYYFGRIESLLPEALAWVPQSTVALVIDRGLVNLDRNLPRVKLLMQVHDSIVMQFPKTLYPSLLPDIKKNLEIVVPYDDPLIIPVGIDVSDKSWGEVKPVDWDGSEIK